MKNVRSYTFLLLYTLGPPAAPVNIFVTFLRPRQQFSITWNELSLVDAYFVNISGPDDLCGNDSNNILQRVTEPSYTCSIQAMLQGGDMYTIRVHATSCNGSMIGQESEPEHLQGMY